MSDSTTGLTTDSPPVPPPLPERSWISVSSTDGNTPRPPLPPRIRPRIRPTTQSPLPRRLPPVPLPSQPSATTAPKKIPAWFDKDCVVREVTTLKGLSERPDDLPAVIRFIDGYYGHTSRFSVSAGDCFQANFVKRTRILTLNDSVGREYTVPLTSSMKFGLLCEDTGPKTISSILAMKLLPHIVCALRGCENKKGKVKITEGDLIIIKSRKQKALHCHNVTTRSDIILQKSYQGTFTLDPAATKMYPLEIVKLLPDVFPCRAKIYFDQFRADVEGCSHLSEKSVTVKGCSIDVSLVATDMTLSSEEESNRIHFPLDKHLSKLRVEILDVGNEQHLYDDAHKVMQSFDPTTGLVYADKETDTAFDIQCTFHRELRPELKNTGVELLTNQSVYKKTSPKEKKIDPSKTSDSPVYDVITPQSGKEQRPSNEHKPSPSPRKRASIPPNTDQCKVTSAATTPRATQRTLHNTSPGKPAAAAQQTGQSSSRNSGSDNDEYTTIDDIKPPQSLPKCSTLKSSHNTASVKSHKPTLPQDLQGQITPSTVTIDSSNRVQADSNPEYTTIPHSSGFRPTAKPRRQSSPAFVAPSTTGQYSTLHIRGQSSENNASPMSHPTPEPVARGYISLCRNPSPNFASSNEKGQLVHQPSSQQLPPAMSRLPPAVSPLPPAVSRRKRMIKQLQEENKAFLKTMNPSQVLQLLDALHMSQYRSRFEEEIIGGDILVECDEKVLETELGVSMKIHRLKLLQVIRGETPAKRLIDDK